MTASRVTLLALVSIPSARAWVTTVQSTYGAQVDEIAEQMQGVALPTSRHWQSQLGSLWHWPESTSETRGLGGGITYAWDPALCDRLMPLFREDLAAVSFIGCEDAQSALFRAMNAWAANSRFVKFVDVTDECAKLGELHANHTLTAANPHGGCPIAELWVTYLERDPDSGDNAIFVATALSHRKASYDFRYTNGDAPYELAADGVSASARPVLETYAGTLAYGVDGESGDGVAMCWYASMVKMPVLVAPSGRHGLTQHIRSHREAVAFQPEAAQADTSAAFDHPLRYLDSYFCSGFHELKADVGSVGGSRALMMCVFLGVTIVTLALCATSKWQFWRALGGCGVSSAAWQRSGATEEERDAAAARHAGQEGVAQNLAEGDFDDVRETVRQRLWFAFEEMAEWNPLWVSLQVCQWSLPVRTSSAHARTAPPSEQACHRLARLWSRGGAPTHAHTVATTRPQLLNRRSRRSALLTTILTTGDGDPGAARDPLPDHPAVLGLLYAASCRDAARTPRGPSGPADVSSELLLTRGCVPCAIMCPSTQTTSRRRRSTRSDTSSASATPTTSPPTCATTSRGWRRRASPRTSTRPTSPAAAASTRPTAMTSGRACTRATRPAWRRGRAPPRGRAAT